MKNKKLLVLITACFPMLHFAPIQAEAATTSVSCLKIWEFDGEKTEMTVSWDDNDPSYIIADGNKITKSGNKDIDTGRNQRLIGLGSSLIKWSSEIKSGNTISTIDRTTGSFEMIGYYNSGNVRTIQRGNCRPSSEGNKF